MSRNLKSDTRGIILPAMVFVVLIFSFVLLGIATFSINQLGRSNKNIFDTNSLLVSEAGAEQTLNQLNQDNQFAGYPTEQEFFNNSTQGRAIYQTTVTNGSLSNERYITSTGRVYKYGSSQILSERKIKLTIVGTTPSGYAVQTGPGGLIMSNSATIANGNVNVNGYLSMSNSSRIGSSTTPVNVSVAHVNCPAGGGPTFPIVCTSGQPITLNNTASIYGAVCATNQTTGTRMFTPGLQPSCVAPAVSLPPHDRQAQVNAVTTNITGSAASCSNSQSRTYAANTKITGNVTISNSCQVTVNGNVWITGNFNISNSSSIKVGSGVTTAPSIMIDGSSGATFSNSSTLLPNTANLGFKFVTYWSNSSCSPDCSDVTGTDLFNSRNASTINLSNSSLGAGSTFYARWSKVTLANSGSVGAVMGQTIQLSNSGNISFGTNISSGQNVWSIKNYQQIYN